MGRAVLAATARPVPPQSQHGKDGDAVTDTKELGKRISKSVAAEAEQAEQDEPKVADVPEPDQPVNEPIPDEADDKDAKAKPTATPSPEQTQKKFERAVSAFRAKLCEVFEVEDLEPSATPGVVGFVLPGYIEKLPHSDFTRCTTCNGWGKVLTGSLKAGDDEHDCPDPRCAGRGYWQKAVEPTPQAQTIVPLPSQAAQTNGDPWDRPSWLGDPRLSSVAPPP